MRYNSSTARDAEPRTPDALWNWIFLHTGVMLARKSVCEGHDSPFDALCCMSLKRPSQMLTLGSRGSGKSFMTAIDSHLCSRFEPSHKTRILGGAKSQARQVQQGIVEAIIDGKGPFGWSDHDQIRHAGVEKFTYHNGSEVEILTASQTSVRGPHVPSLKIDEVDEVEPELRAAAMGMVMDKQRHGDKSGRIRKRSMVSYTSTWHNLGGPMEDLMEKTREVNAQTPGAFPFYKFCLFDVMKRCPDDLSGPNLEYCDSCPLKVYCHEDIDRHGGVPKAKRANGHYSVRDAIQKMQNVSTREFEADYLCRGVKADGLWFSEFDDENISNKAEYNPKLPVHMAIDTGLHTGAVFFQVDKHWVGNSFDFQVNVFADYYVEGLTPEAIVGDLRRIAESKCEGRMDHRWNDPFGEGRNNMGVLIVGEYAKFGMHLTGWPKRRVADGLSLLEGLVRSADGKRRLIIHPRCQGNGSIGQSFRAYRRKKIRGQYLDEPEEPQHPQEETMDALRGGIIAVFPEGRLPQPKLARINGRLVF